MYIGQRIRRKEDLKLITGTGRYVDDINLNGMFYLAILRSNVPHARLKKVNVEDALKLPGVVDVITGLTINVENRPKNFPMAVDEILYAGQPIAAVLAEDRYTAYDALDYISYDYEELPAVIDPEEASKDEVKAVEESSNIAYSKVYKGGNAEKAYEDSEIKIEEKFYISRVYPSPMEPRGLVADYQQDRITVYASTQSPHYMRSYLISAFPDFDFRVIQADVGGAFGSKLFPYAEEYITVYASIKSRRPVKFINTRSEELHSTYHGRGQIHHVKLGASKDGKVNAIIDDLIIDLGAAWHGFYLADISSTLITGPYDIKNAMANIKGVLTNKVPLDQYRGAGRPEAAFVYERMMDILADELRIDPIELRKKNVIKETPYVNPFGLKYDSGNYLDLLNKAEGIYKEMEKNAEELRKQGRKVGVGLSFYVEQNNFGPWESASVRLLANGKVEVIIGAAPHGQGTGTAIAQIVADELGINIDDVSVTWGDTDKISNAFGTYGSRSLTLAGNAALLASRKLKENIIKLVASFLQSDPEEIQYKDGKVFNPKSGKALSLAEIAKMATSNLGGTWNYKAEPTLEATASFGLDNYTFPYGSHIAMVEVDDSGKVRVLDYVAVDDIGLVVNPMLAEGQVEGGIMQGFGEAIMEGIVYDNRGNLLTPSFAEYTIPSPAESFRMKWMYMEEGMSSAPLPAKGIGEGAAIGAPPAIVRAIEKASGRRITTIPVRMEDLI
ncbi:glyceraldehyde dehydrogenase subunit alpha [Acidianus sp. HS-5]|uniref:glyceraldehyde dehydrogenase subunit alpha n=1 Tax=Acidianus sp. HS-5 TaxID=2886040 RepID=UPI001F1AF898|nr:glyceraldehyde dehydrogenase subunit alpha [Acidianus sp. HS-5]BDC17770.1 aldehyde oxidase [Acidianus sp. HS-5]